MSPDLVPAAVAAARAHVAQGKPKNAARVIRRAWEVQPHPDLAAAFAEARPDETPVQRIKRFRALTDVHPDHEETRMLRAELALAAEDFPAARRALGDLATAHPTARSLTLMAAIERGEGADDAVVRAWLARAVTAPRGPQWVCTNCHNIHADWVPVCDNCAAFDTLAWTEPPRAEAHLPGAGMLPLIAGEPAAQAETPPDPHDAEASEGGPSGRPGEPHVVVVEDAPPAELTADPVASGLQSGRGRRGDGIPLSGPAPAADEGR